jgi:hypothetical protein
VRAKKIFALIERCVRGLASRQLQECLHETAPRRGNVAPRPCIRRRNASATERAGNHEEAPRVGDRSAGSRCREQFFERSLQKHAALLGVRV